MKVAIKNPAPRGEGLERWGDFHFGRSLEAALTRQGAEVTQHFWPDWSLNDGEDAFIWLRGKRRCAPINGAVNFIWILSHPATLTKAELEPFDVIFAASNRLATELQGWGLANVEVMLQCTDTTLFRRQDDAHQRIRRGLLFVASSRGVRRPILDWACKAGLSPSLVGHGWNRVGLGSLVSREYVANSALPALYSAARYGMNDHWADMAYYGMINNRIFDCLACGLPVISDGFPELLELTDGGLWTASDAREFKDAYWSIRLDYPGALRATQELWSRIGDQHTFDTRARQFMKCLGTVKPHTALGSAPPPNIAAREILALLGASIAPALDPTRVYWSLLHVLPDRNTIGELASTASLSMLSAGIGTGPWNVNLDYAPDPLGNRRFDLVFIEDGALWAADGNVRDRLDLLVAHLKPGGLIAASDPELLSPLRGDFRLKEIPEPRPMFKRILDHAPMETAVQSTPYEAAV